MSNAHENDPILDQSKLARSRLLVADAFHRDRAAAQKPDAHDTASWLLEQLQQLGWKQPPDPAADTPPLRPPNPAPKGSPGRQEWAQARADLAARTTRSTGHATL